MCEFCEKYIVTKDTFMGDWVVKATKSGKIVARGDKEWCEQAVKAISRRMDVV